MSGGLRLFSALSFIVFLAAAVFAGDDSKTSTPSAPPVAAQKPVIDMYHGTKVLDNYRWLEDGKSPETQKWVEQEMAYTRGILDRLAGREAIHKRLTDLLSIGNVTPPMIAGRHYFYTKREGMQNQPVLYVRDSLNGPDRVLVDANQLAADGTIALDWYYPSENGKYVAYGTSPSGSEMSTLHIIETKTGRHPSRHHRAHARRVSRLEARQLRLLLHALSEKRRRPRRPGDVQPPRLLSRTLPAIPRSIPKTPTS